MIIKEFAYIIKLSFFSILFRFIPINNRKIVISNFKGNPVGNEGYLIIRELNKRGIDFDCVWLVKEESTTKEKGIRFVKNGTILSIKELATAKIWIDNQRKDLGIIKRANQYYIQTWHGSGPVLKCIEKDAVDSLGKKYVLAAKMDSKMADVLVAGSTIQEKRYRDSFWFNGEIIRADLEGIKVGESLTLDRRKEILSLLEIKDDVNIVLYAPTFRENQQFYDNLFDANLVLDAFEEHYGGNWIMIIRLHPKDKELYSRFSFTSRIYNGSLYPQADDVIAISNLVITDYSGVMFHAFKQMKNVILYTPDYDQYILKERSVYFDLTELPAPVCHDQSELVNAIMHYDFDAYNTQIVKYVDDIGYYNSGEEVVVDRIINVMES